MANSNLIEHPEGFPYFFNLTGYEPLNKSLFSVVNKVNFLIGCLLERKLGLLLCYK